MSADADVIGIDLGTTQSLVGVVDAGFPILLADGRGSRMTRSVVYYAKDGMVVVGEEAWRRRVTEGERTVGSIKRLMGRGLPMKRRHWREGRARRGWDQTGCPEMKESWKG